MKTLSSADLPTPSIPAAQLASQGALRKLGAAREFEAQLLSSLLHSVEKTFGSVPDGQTAGGDEYDYLGSNALASALTAGKGFGIASFILKHLKDKGTPAAGAGQAIKVS